MTSSRFSSAASTSHKRSKLPAHRDHRAATRPTRAFLFTLRGAAHAATVLAVTAGLVATGGIAAIAVPAAPESTPAPLAPAETSTTASPSVPAETSLSESETTPSPEVATAPNDAAGFAPALAPDNPYLQTSIRQVSDSSQADDTLSLPNTRVFSYLVTYTCSNVNSDACAATPIITIDLGAARTFGLQLSPSPAIATSEYLSDGRYRVTLVEPAAGESFSGQIGFKLSPPPGRTPNGTSWQLSASLGFADAPDRLATTPQPVTSTATATFDPRIYKTAATQVASPGSTVDFQISYYCVQRQDEGYEYLNTLQIVDNLPAGLEFVSGNLGSQSPTVTGEPASGQTLTWNLAGEQISNWGCGSTSSGTSQAVVRTQVRGDVPDGTKLVNRSSLSATSIGNDGTKRSASEASVLISTSGQLGSVTKTGYGPLSLVEGDPGSKSYWRDAYASGTYPGRWATDNGGVPLNWSASYATEEGRIEADYEVVASIPRTGDSVSFHDAVPCLEGEGPKYLSRTEGLCQTPGFHPLLVQLYVKGGNLTGLDAAFTPTATLVDGSVVALLRVGTSEATPTQLTWTVPDSAIGRVAEVNVPQVNAPRATEMTMQVAGYADAGVPTESTLVNTADVTMHGTDGAAIGTVSAKGRVFTVQRPQIGTDRPFAWSSSGGTANVQTTAAVATIHGITHDLVHVVRIPAGMSLGQIGSQLSCDGNPCSHDHQANPAVTLSTDPATGDTLARFTYPATLISSFIHAGTTRVRALIYFQLSNVDPGDYSINASTFIDDDNVDRSVCLFGSAVHADPNDLDGNGETTDFHCDNSTQLHVDVDAFSTGVRVSKAVQGSTDATFRTYPAIGTVPPTGGEATFRLRWRSMSGQSMNGVVMYDMLPAPDDTGSLANTLHAKRGSTMRPILRPITDLPANVTVQYSTAANPCRPEVLATNPGCSDDWSANAPADLASVTALRFASSATYASREGFDVLVRMGMPTSEIKTSDVAWNTFTTAQQLAQTGQKLDPVESGKVGVALASFAHLSFGKEPSGADFRRGSAMTYRLHVVNDGNATITDATITDTLPEHVSLVDGNGATVDGRSLTWKTGPIAPGQSVIRTVTIDVPADAPPGDYENRMTLTPTDESVRADPDVNPCVDNETQSCVPNHIDPYEVVSLSKTADVQSAGPGDIITYELTMKNTGTADLTDGELEDNLSARLEYVDASVTPANVDPAEDGSPTSISFYPVAVPAGETVTIQVRARVKEGIYDASMTNSVQGYGGARLDNFAVAPENQCTVDEIVEVRGYPLDPQDPPYLNYTACATVKSPAFAPAISLEKTGDTTTVAVGSPATYHFTITNSGAQTLHDVALHEDRFVNAKGEAITLDAAPASVDPNGFNGTLLPGQSAEFSATHTVTQADADAGSELNNNASVSGVSQPGPDGVAQIVTATSSARVAVTTKTVPPSSEPTDTAIPSATGTPVPAPGSDGNLAGTGAEVTGPLALATLLVLAGAALAVRRRRVKR